MEAFLAYFDFLGYKNFIQNNTPEDIDRRTGHIARNIEMALADNRLREGRRLGTTIPDISNSSINCLNFSDTIIFWTNNTTLEDATELIRTCFNFNHFCVGYDFPTRGCMVYGDIFFKNGDVENQRGGRYMLNLIYGQALIDAHLKAEQLDWAGCVIDRIAVQALLALGYQQQQLDHLATLYNVPYKNMQPVNEYAFRLATGGALNQNTIINMSESIGRAFTSDNKGEIVGRVKTLFDNTVAFLNAH